MNEITPTGPEPAAGWPKDRKPPQIDPAWVTVEMAYVSYREIRVRLPEGCALVDVNEVPTLWKLVQGSGKSLRRFDRCTLIAYDESFLLDAVCAGATGTTVTLAGIRRVDLPPRIAVLPGDDLYRIEWAGNGYVVIRRKDGMKMGHVHATVQAAQRALDDLYPRRVA